jgi:hypothetical protein
MKKLIFNTILLSVFMLSSFSVFADSGDEREAGKIVVKGRRIGSGSEFSCSGDYGTCCTITTYLVGGGKLPDGFLVELYDKETGSKVVETLKATSYTTSMVEGEVSINLVLPKTK